MRRMMHAMALFLISASVAQAQNSVRPLPPPPSDEPIVGIGAEYEPNPSVESESLKISASATSNSSAATNFVSAPANAAQGNPDFIPFGSDRPYSQLAVFMNCTQGSPNLWNGYACERAALVAKINQHVDGQCGCSHCRNQLYGKASGPCGGSDCSSAGCADKKSACKVNRYRQPFSTLHTQRSDTCGAACMPNGSSESCTNCQGGEAGNVFPSSAHRPMPTLLAKPPRDRLAAPERNAQPGTLLPTASNGFETRR